MFKEASNKSEFIVCAAVWYKDLPTQEHLSPININKGIVLCGWRHGSIIQQLKTLSKLRTITFAEDGVGEHVQGFLTSKNRFVDRVEGRKIFTENGNTSEFEQLYSEDLY